ncbi:hypothetical protein GCM10025795_25480 [Verticiella sediminum]
MRVFMHTFGASMYRVTLLGVTSVPKSFRLCQSRFSQISQHVRVARTAARAGRLRKADVVQAEKVVSALARARRGVVALSRARR